METVKDSMLALVHDDVHGDESEVNRVNHKLKGCYVYAYEGGVWYDGQIEYVGRVLMPTGLPKPFVVVFCSDGFIRDFYNIERVYLAKGSLLTDGLPSLHELCLCKIQLLSAEWKGQPERFVTEHYLCTFWSAERRAGRLHPVVTLREITPENGYAAGLFEAPAYCVFKVEAFA